MYTKILSTITVATLVIGVGMFIFNEYMQPNHYAFESGGIYIGQYNSLRECMLEEGIYQERMNHNRSFGYGNSTCTWK